jgi:hypothetical protein
VVASVGGLWPPFLTTGRRYFDPSRVQEMSLPIAAQRSATISTHGGWPKTLPPSAGSNRTVERPTSGIGPFWKSRLVFR